MEVHLLWQINSYEYPTQWVLLGIYSESADAYAELNSLKETNDSPLVDFEVNTDHVK